ncbi:MAG: tRNA 2-thiouridine(34) synthase MnmA [Candidatus Magasanikbacteria bacterium]|nr:tRNA 2-thiouridine(34) synthase MnmA [Candidatus Magasanikbacteria bacterium]
MKKNKNKKILVAMSGGVDSSVAAALLVERGYDVTGAFMVNFVEHDRYGLPCYTADYQDALRVAACLGIGLIKIDFTRQYRSLVLDQMFSEYRAGRTPNPDVLCNSFIKFGVWLEKVQELGFEQLATGHYANINEERKQDGDSIFRLMMAKDGDKDQTYFLHQLNQSQLSRAVFPIGRYNKQEVRELARQFQLPTAEKEESMGICFVGEVPMKEFLQKKIAKNPGDIVFCESGEVIGQHEGLAFYTIGQRHGFEQSGGGEPLFVLDKDFERNRLLVGREDNPLLFKKEICLKDIHWICGQEPEFPLHCEVRLRHRQDLQSVTLENNGILRFQQPQKAISPGQSAVFYHRGECLGGGFI